VSEQQKVLIRYPLFALTLILGLLALHNQYRLQASSIGEQRVQMVTITSAGFLPARLQVQQGEQISLAIVNRDKHPRTFVLPGYELQSPLLQPNDSASLSFTASRTGTFPFVSSSPGDPSAKQQGVIIVE